MEEIDLPPPQALQKKFQEWFKDPVPAETDHSIEEPVSADIPFSAEAFWLLYNKSTRKRTYDLEKLQGLLVYGLEGAFFLGAVVGILMFFSDLVWYVNDWSTLIFVIVLAMVIGFFGGMFMRST